MAGEEGEGGAGGGVEGRVGVVVAAVGAAVAGKSQDVAASVDGNSSGLGRSADVEGQLVVAEGYVAEDGNGLTGKGLL